MYIICNFIFKKIYYIGTDLLLTLFTTLFVRKSNSSISIDIIDVVYFKI